MKFGLCLPTRNAGPSLQKLLDSIHAQKTRPFKFLVVDSSSEDGTVLACRKAGAQVRVIPQEKFNHGGTRWKAVGLLKGCPVVVFLTQDAVLADPGALGRLLQAFRDPQVGVAYGRQLPHPHSGLFGAHARLFNYPEVSSVKTLQDVPRLGIKTAFTSNSFAAYRVTALRSVGGFASDVILSEDMCAAGRMILAGWKVAYVAEARVYHSHDYSPTEEFKRYFDIGVLHAREPWILRSFGTAEGEGKRFVLSEIRYLASRAPWLLPMIGVRTAFKWAGYRLGILENRIPLSWKRRWSMNRSYWRS